MHLFCTWYSSSGTASGAAAATLLHAPLKLCMFQIDCDHDAFECQCYARPGAAAQSLDELEFVRSACHAAQLGQLDKLERILRNRPEAISWDGGTGGYMGVEQQLQLWVHCNTSALNDLATTSANINKGSVVHASFMKTTQ